MAWWKIALEALVIVGGIVALGGELWLYDWWLWQRHEPKTDRRNWTPLR